MQLIAASDATYKKHSADSEFLTIQHILEASIE